MSALYNQLYRKKARAKWRVQQRVRRGQIEKPDNCQKCNAKVKKAKLQAHHPDYDKPLDIIWLCAQCHVKIHKETAGNNLNWHGYRKGSKVDFFNDNEIAAKCKCVCEKCGFYYLADNGGLLDLKDGKPIQSEKTPLCGKW